MMSSKPEQLSDTVGQMTVAAEPAREPQAASPLPKPDATGAANLDKVRDILFGNQLRDVERRFARMEERLMKETRDMKDDVKKLLGALELYMRNETESLAAQIKTEHDERVTSNGSLARELKDSAASLERRIAGVDEQLSKGQRELRQQMLDQHQSLSDDIRQKVDDVLAALAREAGELRTDKADRTALAALLTEMALRLTNDSGVAGAEEVGNA